MTGDAGGPPGRIFILRHGEKPPAPAATPRPPFGVDADGNPNPHSLTPRGWQRCGALGLLFAPGAGPVRAGLSRPDRLLCPDYGADTPAHRTYQTLLAVSACTGVAIESPYAENNEPDLARAVVNGHQGTALICWEHKRIPRIAAALPVVAGAGVPTDWPERFDLIWSFTLSSGDGDPPLYAFNIIPELVLDGDTAG